MASTPHPPKNASPVAKTKPPSSQASSLVSTTKVGGGEVTHADVGDDPTMHCIAGEVEKDI